MPSQDHTERNRRRRMRALHRRTLLRRLKLQAEVAFESNAGPMQQAVLNRMLLTLLLLLDTQLNDQRRKEILRTLESCSYLDEAGYRLGIEWDRDENRDLVTLNGSVNLQDLASKIVWAVGVPETLEG